MKIGIFTDPHYSLQEKRGGNRRPALSWEKLAVAMEDFLNEKVDFCICLGDLVDDADRSEPAEARLVRLVEKARSYGIPLYFLGGNHDFESFTPEEFAKKTASPRPPFRLDTPTHRFLFLDANYRSDFRHFSQAGVEWTDSNLPPLQTEFLKKELASSEKPAVICLHENLDPRIPEDHRIKNAAEVRCILEESGRVALVLQGHYHKGADHTVNGIRYFTPGAMCVEEENPHPILIL